MDTCDQEFSAKGAQVWGVREESHQFRRIDPLKQVPEVNAVAKFLNGRFTDTSQEALQFVTCSILLENGQVFLNIAQHLETVGLLTLTTSRIQSGDRLVVLSFFETSAQALQCDSGKPLPATLQKLLCTLTLSQQEDAFVGIGDGFKMQISREQLPISTRNRRWQIKQNYVVSSLAPARNPQGNFSALDIYLVCGLHQTSVPDTQLRENTKVYFS